MTSILKLIEDLNELKKDHKQHNFSAENLQTIDELLVTLEALKHKDKVKDYSEITLILAKVVKSIMDLFN